MKQFISAIIGLVTAALLAHSSRAVEPTWEYSVQVSAAAQASPPQITLTWPQDTRGVPNSYTVYRKAPGATTWGTGTTLAGSATSYADTGVAVGTAYEYRVVKSASGSTGYGYVLAGIQVPLVENRGKLVLVVDSTHAAQLAPELARLQQDLAGDGWTVLRRDVARTDSAASVKNVIKTAYNTDPANVKAVFLFGHVPVPYSGQLNPDGHPDHVGAWPADVYYGDVDGTWTDSSVNYTQTVNTDPADRARLSNVPGDGKFDQTTIPSAVELQVGRVDLANLPGRTTWGGPATFPSELELLRQYLNKDHNFRHKLLNVQRRGIVGDYFGTRNGEAFAASGYRSFAPFFGASAIKNLNVDYNDQKGKWIPELAANDYLFAYGCGAGSYQTIGGLGNTGQYNDGSTTELVGNNIRAVFVLLFGSWLGDWDHEDNIMRSVLATRDYGLASAWSGRPHWFLHPMGLGETIGSTARLTQNNTGLYQNQINSAASSIHVALMGDPTLRLHPVAPPASLGGSAIASGATLAWTPSPDSVLGYHVYRAADVAGPFTRLTSSLLAGTTLVDTSAPAGTNIYMVRAVKLETSASGTYYNASQGIFWSVGGAPVPTQDTTPPSVAITTPANGATISGNPVTFSATAADNVGVVGVQFKFDGNNLGSEILSAPFNLVVDTTTAANGPHTLSAVARDLAGNQTTASVVNLTVSNTTGNAQVWIEDALPGGATGGASGGDSWSWVSSNPAPFSGTVAHQSAIAAGLHEHYFSWASATLSVGTGDTLFTYVYLDPANPPTELMLSWSADNWEHRAYWGANSITYGTDGTASRRYMGTLPAAGQWVRLEVPASAVALEGQTVTGMSFSLFGGRATWDYTGKSGQGTTPPPPADTTSPSVALAAPLNGATVSGSSVTVSASASDNVGVAGVQFKLDGSNLGSEVTAAPFALAWNTTTAANGTHTLTAVARDAAGNTATATTVSVTVNNVVPDTTAPAVSLTAPANGSTVSGSSVTISASASDNVGVAGVQFKLDGANLGAEVTSAPYSVVWNTTSSVNGSHSLSAVARDAAGNQTTATSVTVSVNNAAATPNTVWFDDALPAGAGSGASGGDAWTWVSSNPAPFSGTVAHQSAIASGLHEHYFSWASATLSVATGDTLFTYVYLDPANPPTELMLSWVADNWEHRAYWGANTITYGTDGTASRRYMGALPAPGQWVRLEVPASAVGLEGQTLTGMSFSLYGGRATWDYTGKGTDSAPAPTVPTVTVLASDATATIGTSDNAALTFARTGDTSAALTVNYTLGGSAVKWNDYRTPAGDMPEFITIPAGVASATLTIVGVTNSTAANPETVVCTLASDAAYTVGSASSATITLLGGTVATNPPPVTNYGTNQPLVSVLDYVTAEMPKSGDNTLHVLAPTMLELVRLNTKQPDPARVDSWDFVDASGQFIAPAASKFAVTINGQPVAVQTVGFKRRPFSVPLVTRDLRIMNSLFLQLASPVADGQTVEVTNPDGTLWSATMRFTATANPLRYSPAIHVNQEGYVPAWSKKAMVGYYLGNLGEMNVPTLTFSLVEVQSGNAVFSGSLVTRPDVGYPYSPAPYQKVYEADFSSFTTPGEYRLVVPGLGASLPFLIDEGVAMAFTRTYALGLYHQRCGASNALPFTRCTHPACHTAQADVPLPMANFPFTWTTVSNYALNLNANNPAQTAPALTSEATHLYPFVNQGKIDVSGGHHDAGDYSKYTINSAGLIHYLMFAVDAFPGVGQLDNLGLPESGDGISDLMQSAKWEADYLAKLQDADGGFYFIVYPRNREYESNVLPENGDPQVVWPKTTSATAAAVAALAQTASSPRFKQQYPTEAALYLQKARLGWSFLTNAVTRFGKAGAYQKITHYGDNFTHDDELAWAASEMFVATGEAQYAQKLAEWFPNPNDPATYRWGWWRMSESWGNAIRSYAFAARSGRLAAGQLDGAYLAKCEAEVKAAGNDQLLRSQQNAYGSSFPVDTKRVLSAGWYFSTEQSFDIAVAYQLDPRADYVDAMLANLNYEGGCNPVNVSYVTGLGWKRQREIVHQYAQNDRRILPPSGIPLGNIQSSFQYLNLYGSELGALCYPSDNATTAPFPFYDRWSDAFNVTTEFVAMTSARNLAGIAFLAAQTAVKTQAWTSATAQIIGLPAQVGTNTPVTAILQVPGLDLSSARLVWEARDQEPSYATSFTFTPKSHGEQWVEVEAQLPDGRRVFAMASFSATNSLPTVSVVASDATAVIGTSDNAVFTFTRTGDTSAALTVNYQFSGTAAKWTDYRRPEGDMPESVTIPAGVASTTLTIMAVANSTGANPATAILTLSANADYNVGTPAGATVTLLPVSATDTTAPTVSLTAPSSSATVSGSSVTVSANASDNVGVVGVQFKLDGANLGAEDTGAPFSVTWNTTTVADGLHTLTAVARDAAGNQATATSVAVTISNSVPVVLPMVTVAASDATATIGTSDNAAFTFTRTGDTSAALTVNYALGGTAVKWNDYRTPAGDMPVSVTIPAGANSTTVTLVAVANETGANPQTVLLTLSPDATYTVGAPGNAMITLLAPPPVVLPTVNVTASDASASRVGLDAGTFTLTRSGDTSLPLVLNYSLGGTAANGADYSTLATSATIPAGSSSTTVTVQPLASTNLVAAKSVVLTLSASATYTLGATNGATVTIAGNSVPITSLKATGNGVRITWPSVAGKSYRVAYKNSVSDTVWTSLSGFITATGTSTTWTDTSAGASKQRYYAVYVTN